MRGEQGDLPLVSLMSKVRYPCCKCQGRANIYSSRKRMREGRKEGGRERKRMEKEKKK